MAMDQVASGAKRSVTREPRLRVSSRRGKRGVPIHSEFSKNSLLRVWIEEAKCLSSVEVLKDVTQLDLERFQILSEDLGSG